MLRECVVTDGVRVPADTSWHGVTIRRADGELAPRRAADRRIWRLPRCRRRPNDARPSDVHATYATRIDQFLAETGLAARGAQGRAADRRRLRPALLPRAAARTSRRRCWRCIPGRSTFEHAAVRQRRAPAQRDAGAGAAHPRALRTRSASSRCRISATSRCRRISARPRRPSTPRSTARRCRSSTRCSGAARELASPDYLPYGIAFDVEKLTWELQFFAKHFLEAYRGAALDAGRARGAGRRVRGDRRGARRRSRACSVIATITAAT